MALGSLTVPHTLRRAWRTMSTPRTKTATTAPKKASTARKDPKKAANPKAAVLGARSFADCLAAFTDAVGAAVTEQNVSQAWVETAFSAGNLGAWTSSPPTSCIYRVRDPMSYSAAVLKEPKKTLGCIGVRNALATWNARGTGTFACGKGWLIASVNLVQEQASDDGEDDAPGNYVSVAYGLVRVTDGWVGALWDGPVETLARVLGLDGVSLGTACSVWYGE